MPENLTYIGDKAFAANVYNSDYTAKYWVGPTTVYLNGKLDNIGASVFRPDAKIIAVLNSQRNMVGGCSRSRRAAHRHLGRPRLTSATTTAPHPRGRDRYPERQCHH